MTPQEIARRIDHTLLKPDATESDIARLCDEAAEHSFFSVCVNSRYVPFCAKRLQGSDVLVCSVVGFPLGAMDTFTKATETERAFGAGAREIDMVLPIGALKDKQDAEVLADIRAVVRAAGSARVKVILETSLLAREEKIRACELSRDAGAAFVKTSTGFGGGGATVDDVRLMKATVGAVCEVKASGGIRDLNAARAMIEAGASRLGTSSGVAILKGLAAQGAY